VCGWLQLAYIESSGGAGKLSTAGNSTKSRLVPCFPLQALLVALNRSTVDYFSLDVEGFELEVRTEFATSNRKKNREFYEIKNCKNLLSGRCLAVCNFYVITLER